MSISHRFNSAKADSTDATLINPSNWNATHFIGTPTNLLSGSGVVLGTDVSGELTLDGLKSSAALQYLRRNSGNSAYEFGTLPVTQTGIIYVPTYDFAALAPGISLAIGSNSITLSVIPIGLAIGNSLYISGGTLGTAESVPITAWNSTTGVVIVTCASIHTGAWTIQSASNGIQESFVYANSILGGKCHLPAGNYTLRATVNCYTGVHLEGQGRYATFIYRTGDFGSSFKAVQVNDVRFTAFQIQQTIVYTAGTPGSATNLATNGAHFEFKGVNGAYLNFVRCQDGFKNVSITGGAELFFIFCSFYGTYDGRASSPKATSQQFAIENYDVTYGLPTFIRIIGCDFVGANNGTANTSSNYAGLAGQYGIVINTVEDFEMVGGFMGGANSANVLINAQSLSYNILNIKFVGVRFDSAAIGDIQFTGDGISVATQNVSILDCQFNGQLAAQNAIVVGNPGSGVAIVFGLVIADCTAFNYGYTAFNIQDGKGIKISNNLIYNYNKFISAASSQASGIYIAGRATLFHVSANCIGGGQLFEDYGAFNTCLFGIKVGAFGTTNKGTISANTTPNGTASIGTAGDLVFWRPDFTAAIQTYQIPNYIATESGANNALVCVLTDPSGGNVPLAAGLQITIKLAHTLQIGANTLSFNTVIKNIKSNRNTANNIAVGYVIGSILTVIYDGTQWLDISQ